MSAGQLWRLGRTFLVVAIILGITNLNPIATIVVAATSLTLLWKAETR
jgi:hypothetical protein